MPEVTAKKIVDLRNSLALAETGVRMEDAIALWQEFVARGHIPRSWTVRDRLVACGANGLIDPSRKAPGLRHLVLFAWNRVTHRRSISLMRLERRRQRPLWVKSGRC